MSFSLNFAVAAVFCTFLVAFAVPETCEGRNLECHESLSQNQVETVEESMTEDMQFQLLQAGQSMANNEDTPRPKHAAFQAKQRRKKAIEVSSEAKIDLSGTEPLEDSTSDDSTTRSVSPVSGMSHRAARAIATQRKLEEQHRTAEKMLATKLANRQAANKARQELAASAKQGQMPQVMQMPYAYSSGMQTLPGMQVAPMNAPSSMSSVGAQQLPPMTAMAPMQQGYPQAMP